MTPNFGIGRQFCAITWARAAKLRGRKRPKCLVQPRFSLNILTFYTALNLSWKAAVFSTPPPLKHEKNARPTSRAHSLYALQHTDGRSLCLLGAVLYSIPWAPSPGNAGGECSWSVRAAWRHRHTSPEEIAMHVVTWVHVVTGVHVVT